jgi:hypothetical protein
VLLLEKGECDLRYRGVGEMNLEFGAGAGGGNFEHL